jgi:hypothetical protein
MGDGDQRILMCVVISSGPKSSQISWERAFWERAASIHAAPAQSAAHLTRWKIG